MGAWAFDESKDADRHIPALTSPSSDACSSFLVPSFLRQLMAPEIKTVLVWGCGGGFDFMHSMLLYPELRRMGKSVVIVSNSFGDPASFTGESVQTVFTNPEVRTVTAAVSEYDEDYAPEVHVASFL